MAHALCAGHKSSGKKQGSVTYSKDQENEVNKILYLRLIRHSGKKLFSNLAGCIMDRKTDQLNFRISLLRILWHKVVSPVCCATFHDSEQTTV